MLALGYLSLGVVSLGVSSLDVSSLNVEQRNFCHCSRTHGIYSVRLAENIYIGEWLLLVFLKHL